MRFATLVTCLSLLVLAASGALYARASRSWAGEAPRAALEEARAAFVHGYAPRARFNVQALFAAEGRLALVDPRTTLPQAFRLPRQELLRLADYRCGEAATASHPEVAKALVWAAFRCGQPLPAGFFSSAPYMHPSGESYVSLALRTGQAPFSTPSWLADNLPYMHVLERAPWARSDVSASGTQGPVDPALVLSTLTRPGLAAVLAGEVAQSRDWLLLPERTGEAGVDYAAYAAKDWAEATRGLPFTLIEHRSGLPCSVGTGYYCWAATGAVASARRAYAVTAVGALALLIAAVASIVSGGWRERRRERAAQLFLTRALAHELRTPATSIGLALDTMRGDFDRLPAASQQAFLRLCDDAQRLGRVIAGSAAFLRTAPGQRAGGFARQDIVALEDFFTAVLEPYGDKIEVDINADAAPFSTDPYWLRVVVTNLVDNALRHGKPPVAVQIRRHKARLDVTVRDHGTLSAEEQRRLSRGVVTPTASAGLGLGLTVVRQTVKGLGGRLTVTGAPTTFTVRLPEAR